MELSVLFCPSKTFATYCFRTARSTTDLLVVHKYIPPPQQYRKRGWEDVRVTDVLHTMGKSEIVALLAHASRYHDEVAYLLCSNIMTATM
jgi:hypothetical protein